MAMLPWFCDECSKKGTCESKVLISLHDTLLDGVSNKWHVLAEEYKKADEAYESFMKSVERTDVDGHDLYGTRKELFHEYERKQNSLRAFEKDNGISSMAEGLLLAECNNEVGKKLLKDGNADFLVIG